MAFTTLKSATGTDFIGTAAVDALFALNVDSPADLANSDKFVSVDGAAGDDIINLSDSNGFLAKTIVRGNDGDDQISFDGAGGTAESVLSSFSTINGGKGEDNINIFGATESIIRGNEDADDINLGGNYNNSTITGNDGSDSFVLGAATTLQSTKIQGGNANDGLMNFARLGFAFTTAVDSTINGGKGNDNITIGGVNNVAGFTVFGGEGNDVLSSNNNLADSVVYSGDKGDDQIDVFGSADATALGGEGDDIITSADGDDSIDGGVGVDDVVSGNGDDTVILGDGNDTYTDGAGDDTITGGAGADTFNVNRGDNNYVISALSDSAATLTGTSQGFDTFSAGFSANTDHIDLTDIAESLLGDRVSGSTTVAAGANIASATTTFAALRAELNNALSLTASGANVISFNVVVVDDGVVADTGIDGTYIIVNNANNIMDSTDAMFAVNNAEATTLGGVATAGGEYSVFSTTEGDSAWII